jgi:hypothetical protein
VSLPPQVQALVQAESLFNDATSLGPIIGVYATIRPLSRAVPGVDCGPEFHSLSKFSAGMCYG